LNGLKRGSFANNVSNFKTRNSKETKKVAKRGKHDQILVKGKFKIEADRIFSKCDKYY